MRGAVLQLVRHGRVAQRRAAGLPRQGKLNALPGGATVDLRGAAAQVARCQQAGPVACRGLHKGRITEVLAPVGKRQARGLGVQVQPVGTGLALHQGQAAGGGVVQHAQNLTNGNRPRTWRRHAANAHRAGCRVVVKAQRFAHQRAVGCQVAGAQAARVGGVALHFAGDGFTDLPPQQGRGAAGGYALQHRCQFGVAQHMAGWPWLACSVVKVSCCYRVFFQVRVCRQQCGHARADGKTLVGQVDSGLKQLSPRQFAVQGMCLRQHGDRARHTHRATAHYRIGKLHGLA